MVARELHDRVAQTLTGMLVDVENFKSQQVGWDDVLLELDSIQTSTRKVLSSLRQLLHDLRGEGGASGTGGSGGSGGSFLSALDSMVSRFEEKTSIHAELDVTPGWPAAMAPAAALNLYRIVEEALANVRMHSGASTVRVVLDAPADDQFVVMIDDDGRGQETHFSRPVGLGTVGMKERAALLGGKLKIESETGSGTTVYATFSKAQLVPGQPSATKEEFLVSRSLTA